MAKLLWKPTKERIEKTNLKRFMDTVNKTHNQNFVEYEQLYQWSIDNIPEFWALMWDFEEIIASTPYDQVIDDLGKMPGAKWFSGARLNFAENLLRYRDDQKALIFRGEDQVSRSLTYSQLYKEVAGVAKSLKEIGVKTGDRVVGFMPNMPETIIAMLAAASIGATWSSCSPDFGVKGAMDRFGQIKPKVIFTANGYFYKGKHLDSLERVSSILKQLPSIEKVIVVSYTEKKPDISGIPYGVYYEDFKSTEPDLELEFEQLPFEHPLYIMYSSGTTGLPKCMVQPAGGILINQKKEHVLHTDLKRSDTIFYFTTCGWMMWNWLACSLSVGATLVLFDGNPFHPDPGALWKIAEEEKITVFGTSAAYINAIRKADVKPGRDYDLSPLKSVLSTGAPLSVEDFEYIYREVKTDMLLSSITGGTDLNGVFAGGNPMGAVYAGEISSRNLGMKVEAFDENGKPVLHQVGELVCSAPFPSMPIYFWNDPDNRKYQNAYFDIYPNVWRHGDFIKITERNGIIVFGRSDATLNPGGVRIGTAEIYRQLDQLEEVDDSVVIGQKWKNDTRIVLFVQTTPGIELTDELKNKIRKAIRENVSPRHVPANIIQVGAIPYTYNGKKVELAVRNVVHNQPVLNKDSLQNPEVLDNFANLPELQKD
ncbi:MAG: acetoacetate--CoA ligase [Deltaproteobacteria bacterium]|jgi:acetoacetyl-CoA synthetase|nr:acetoacetate--CoA ligase [Deltaproteobacteria bacterium]MBT4644247.1 acetoacetate--CoA ligase [Deltaproteobacteria bacterium]MBT6503215.1 acetoacetate--CoA ligase [Deltaproteobacteria bacterium]